MNRKGSDLALALNGEGLLVCGIAVVSINLD